MKSQRNQILKINGSLKKMISNYKIINMSKSKAKIMMINIMSFQVCLKKLKKKKDQTQKCNICHIVHPVFTNKLETNYSFSTKLGSNLGLTTRLMVIEQFWRWLNTLLEIMFTFITSNNCHPLEIDCNRCCCPFSTSKCSFKASSSKKLSLLGYWFAWTTLLSWKTWSRTTSLPRERTTP